LKAIEIENWNSDFSGAVEIDGHKKLKGPPSGGSEDGPVSRNNFYIRKTI
jgi:hypothetical protein